MLITKYIVVLATLLPHWSAAAPQPTSLVGQQIFSIKGKLPEDFKGKQLLLYKYKSAFDKELISTSLITDHTFIFQNELVEPDAYLIKNPTDNTFFVFIWDGNLTIDLTNSEFHKPLITGSSLSTELNQFNQAVQTKYVQPVHKIDSLIDTTKEKVLLDSLRLARRDLMDWSMTSSETHQMKYCRDHPDSFVSLFLLTLSGDRLPIAPDYRAAFDGLSGRLKRHSRAKYYLDR